MTRGPRSPRPAFAEGVETLEDLVPGMVLEGVVTNVAAFGAFVDIGVHQDGLVHVSAMSRTFVSDPRQIVKPGDVVRVRVLGVDIPRKRISLTLRLEDEAADRGGACREAGREAAGQGGAGDAARGRGAGGRGAAREGGAGGRGAAREGGAEERGAAREGGAGGPRVPGRRRRCRRAGRLPGWR